MSEPSGDGFGPGAPWALEVEPYTFEAEPWGDLDIGPYEPLTLEGTDWGDLIQPWEPLDLEPFEPLEVDWSFLDTDPNYDAIRTAYTEPDLPDPGGPGRKGPRLSDRKVQRFLAALDNGLFICMAAEWAGIGDRTARRWLARGKADEAAGVISNYLQLWQAAQVAQAIATDRALRVINRAIRDGDWKAARWMLEHRWTERWGDPNPPRPGPAERARRARGIHR